jgi:hypothetical protein
VDFGLAGSRKLLRGFEVGVGEGCVRKAVAKRVEWREFGVLVEVAVADVDALCIVHMEVGAGVVGEAGRVRELADEGKG